MPRPTRKARDRSVPSSPSRNDGEDVSSQANASSPQETTGLSHRSHDEAIAAALLYDSEPGWSYQGVTVSTNDLSSFDHVGESSTETKSDTAVSGSADYHREPSQTHAEPSTRANTSTGTESAGEIEVSTLVLQQTAQTILDNLQAKRHRDAQMVDDYKQSLQNRVMAQVERLQNSIYDMHRKRNNAVQPLLHELQSALQRCKTLESELSDFKQRLQQFNNCINC